MIEDSSLQQSIFSILYITLTSVILFFFNYMIDEKLHWLSKLNFLLCLVLSIIKLSLPHSYTYPFLLNVSANASIFAYGYFIFYRIGYVGFKYFLNKYKENRKLKAADAFFNSIKYSWNTKIEFVLLLIICPSYSSFITDYVFFTKYDAHYYASDFTFLIFYGLMAFFTYRRKFQLVEHHRRELEKLHWETETEKLRSELAIKEKRDKIFADIHDNLGGKLLDLSFGLDKIQLDKPVNLDVKKKLKNQIEEVLRSLRSRLLAFEDMQRIETNFKEGIENFLLRRYSLIERKIQFQTDSNFENISVNKKTCLHLVNIFQELVNNDLKYGSGKTTWNFSLEDNVLYLHFQSQTEWDNTRISTGNGHKTIQSRVKELKGKYFQHIKDSLYSVELKCPIAYE